MTVSSHLKKKLQDNLSLSAKLLLKELVYASKRGVVTLASKPVNFAKRVEGVASAWGIPLPGNHSRREYSLAPLSLDVSHPPSLGAFALKKSRAAATRPIQISIIIPVFNQARYTYQCLSSLFPEIDPGYSEVIIVNDGSTDETEYLLAQLPDLVRVVTNTENRGFIEACNQGSSIARGQYLVFLNNDTEVCSGWLKHLVETIEGNLSVGAVGSMLLYPDGSIQEAGAIVWKNGEAHHYGWGHSPDDRRFNFAREVDYCSAASLLVRNAVFQRLGGFDRTYGPNYYEDVDLCMGVRSLGLAVMYQPLSRVVHYEGVTAGRDVSKGPKRFQLANREKFVAQWHEVLEHEHLVKDLRKEDEAANRKRNRPRILVFDERVPSPDRDAGSARMVMILKTLVQWSNVVFVPFYRHRIEYEQELWKAGIETANAVEYRRLLRRENVKAAIVSRPNVAAALIPRIHRINKKIKIVFDMVDVHFIRLEREHQISGQRPTEKEARRLERVETKQASASHLIWCSSTSDKQVMEEKVPGKRIEVIPTIHEVSEAGKPFAERRDLLFIGNLAHRPNEDAIHLLVREIFPQVRRSLPSVKLFVIGDNVSAAMAAYNSESVRIMGYVPNIDPYWDSSRVFVAPLRFGAGIKGKVGEAMAHGLPLVTSAIGAEGFGLTNGVQAIIVDDAEDFAAAVTQVYSQKDLWEALARNSRSHIKRHFSLPVVAKAIDNSLKETIGICDLVDEAHR